MSDSNIGATVPLRRFIEEHKLKAVFLPENLDTILLRSTDMYRPGLQLATGFFDYFDNDRIQVFGHMETSYIKGLSTPRRTEVLENICSRNVPAILMTRGNQPCEQMSEACQKYGVPALLTDENTSAFMAMAIAWLNLMLAQRITRHGVLVEVYGEGVLILGDSGVGKSETAVELVNRGHRLVADDAVEIIKASAKTLVGSSPDIIRHFVELRGIGIVDIKNIFGMGAVKNTEKIDLVIHLEVWKEGKQYDRVGLTNKYTNFMGIDVPALCVPVRPGRNLAIIVEIAAMNNRQKKMGYNAAEALNERLINGMKKKNNNLNS